MAKGRQAGRIKDSHPVPPLCPTLITCAMHEIKQITVIQATRPTDIRQTENIKQDRVKIRAKNPKIKEVVVGITRCFQYSLFATQAWSPVLTRQERR